MLELDPLYVMFMYEFNETRDYFECHEVMEQLWLENGRNPLYQGLLQVAVGLYHHHNDNVNGAVKLLTLALEKLTHADGDNLGIDLEKLKVDTTNYLAQLHNREKAPFAPYHFDIVLTDERLIKLVIDVKKNPPQHEGDVS
jgi:predicted metal-dependent hydrolase